MSRIISGRYGGLYLQTAKHHVRPTTAKVKSYLFNVLQRLDGEKVLDLFAGGGALGIEALSRGAGHVTFVDLDQRSLKLIRQNLEHIGVEENSCTVIKDNALRFIRRETEKYDLILADPPYGLELPEDFFESCRVRLNPGGMLILEYGTFKDIRSREWQPERVKKMGDTVIRIFENHDDI